MAWGVLGVLCDGRGVPDKRLPFAGTLYVSVGGLGQHPAVYVTVRFDGMVVGYRHAEYQRLLVYATGVPEVARQLAVELLLFVGVAYEVPYVDVAYGDNLRSFMVWNTLEGDVVLVRAVRNESGESCLPYPWSPTAGGPRRTPPWWPRRPTPRRTGCRGL